MTGSPLRQLAEEAGILCQWRNAHGEQQSLEEDILRSVLCALELPADSSEQAAASQEQLRQRKAAADRARLLVFDAGKPVGLLDLLPAGSHCTLEREDGSRHELQLDTCGQLPAQPWGYHRLSCDQQQWTLACAPASCPSVKELTGRQRLWGIAAQVYALRRSGDAGLGDLCALSQLIESAASLGADAIAISPLHAMFSSNPGHCSPYSPSSRSHFNILHASPGMLLGDAVVREALRHCGLVERAAALESLGLIDWPAAADLRLTLLRHLYERMASLPDSLQDDFRQFRLQSGESLQLHCCHEALQRHMLDRGLSADWHDWPAVWQHPDSVRVRRFADEHAAELGFHAFGQWLATRGLEKTQRLARHRGMGIGLIADMAIGADPTGSFGWACQQQLLGKVSIGAPPDLLSKQGQNWGVAAFCPLGLREHGYRAFIEMVRANLQYSGGLRIDHIMGLQRLWIIPQGESPNRGAYLSYPLDDMLRLLTLEARRHRALIIGEDLGTVPAGLQRLLSGRNILGMRVLQFEQAAGKLPAPQHWPIDALATTGTHDLPTTLGWLSGHDIHWRQTLGQLSAGESMTARRRRAEEVAGLDEGLRQQQLLGAAGNLDRLTGCLRFLGRTPAPLVLVPLEDVMASTEQPNLPGSDERHPNWRRRWPDPASAMLTTSTARRRLQALDQERRNRGPEHD